MRAGQQKAVAAGVAQLDLESEPNLLDVIEPVEGAAAAGFHAGPGRARSGGGEHAPVAGGGDAVGVPVGEADGFGEARGELLERFERGGRRRAGVGVRIEDLLGVGVEIEEADDLGVVVLGFVADPLGEAAGLDGVEGAFAREGFRARVVFRRGVVPLERIGVVEVDAFAEPERRLLSVLAPQPVRLPCIDVAIRVEGGDEDPVEFFEELGHGGELAVAGDEGPCHIVDRAGADPFTRVRSACDDDGLSRRRGLFRVGGVDANAQGGDVSAFIGYPNVDHANVGREERSEEAHPRNDDGEGLIVLEKYVAFF